MFQNRSDFTIRRQLVEKLLEIKGQDLVTNLLEASVFCLSSYMMSDVADVIVELTLMNREVLITI